MPGPQLEDGYTRIANEILEALAKIRIPGEARQCLDVIIRKTYGWSRKETNITLNEFYLMTNIPKSSIVRGLRKLVVMNLIYQKVNENKNTYRFNKDYSSWKPFTKKSTIYQKVNDHLPKSKKPFTKKSTPYIVIKEKKETIKERESTPHTLEDVKKYFIELGYNDLEAEKFYDHFSSNGWKVSGRAPMKDWKAAARNWCRRLHSPQNLKAPTKRPSVIVAAELRASGKKKEEVKSILIDKGYSDRDIGQALEEMFR